MSRNTGTQYATLFLQSWFLRSVRSVQGRFESTRTGGCPNGVPLLLTAAMRRVFSRASSALRGIAVRVLLVPFCVFAALWSANELPRFYALCGGGRWSWMPYRMNTKKGSDSAVVLGVLLLLLLPSVSFAASFYVDGVCYSDMQAAAEAWESRYPSMNQSQNSLDFVGQPVTVDAAGLMTYRIDRQALGNGNITVGSVNSVQLTDCTGKNFIEVGKVDRILMLGIALIMFAFGLQFAFRFFSNQVPGE